MPYETKYATKWKQPSPKEYEGNVFCMTINPAVKAEDSIQDQYGAIVVILTFLEVYTNFKFYLEVSPAGKLHVHGYMSVSKGKTAEFVAITIPILRKLCVYDISEISDRYFGEDDFNSWTWYMEKEAHIWFKFLKKQKILHKITSRDIRAFQTESTVQNCHDIQVRLDLKFKEDWAPKKSYTSWKSALDIVLEDEKAFDDQYITPNRDDEV